MDTKKIYAGKVVSKGLLVKQHQKDKVSVITSGKFELMFNNRNKTLRKCMAWAT